MLNVTASQPVASYSGYTPCAYARMRIRGKDCDRVRRPRGAIEKAVFEVRCRSLLSETKHPKGWRRETGDNSATAMSYLLARKQITVT